MENNEVKHRPYTAEELLERIFYYVGQLADIKDFKEAIITLTGLGRDMVNSERASFWFWDKRRRTHWTIAALGRGQIIVPEGKGIVGASIMNNEVVLINNPYEDPRFNSNIDRETGFVTKSILCIPVMDTKGNVIGAYQAINKLDENGESNFDDQDIKRLSMAAMFCGKTLESHILYMDAQMDQLTGLKNRRGFYEYYNDKIDPLVQDGKNAAIIMCDIDHFKHVNDTYGHNAGDAVLKHVAKHLEDAMYDIGEVIRWGGEEFIMLLPGYDLDLAKDEAEKIRESIMKSSCFFDETEIKITMSFGVKKLNAEFDAEKNVELVDANLYEAKETGRNKVVFS